MTFFSAGDREQAALAAEHGHVASAQQVVHVEGGELGALASEQEAGHAAGELRLVDAVDR